MRTLLMTLLLAVTTVAHSAGEPDFYVVTDDCKTLVGTLGQNTVKLVDADKPSFACMRDGKQVSCVVSYSANPNKSYPVEVLDVDLDSGPLLYLSSARRFFVINTVEHTASHSERMSVVGWLAEKVCVGAYVTGNEWEMMKNWRNR